MSKYRECEFCGAALDPGERCDCQRKEQLALACTQRPVIAENLDSVKHYLEAVLAEVSALPSDDDSLKRVKAIRADLSKRFEAAEIQRKAVKRQVMTPYEHAMEKYNACITDPYKAADATLKAWVDDYQNGMKKKCEDALRTYFDECCRSFNIDFLKFEKCGVVVDMALARQKSHQKAEDKIYSFVHMVRSDLDAISAMEDAADILAEYRKCLGVAQAVMTVADQKKAKASMQAFLDQMEERRTQQAQNRAQIMAAVPELQTEEKVSVAFRATGKLDALKAMKQYALGLGITFEDIT